MTLIRVAGYCPACGRKDLVVESLDPESERPGVHCNSGICPDFLAATKVLQDPEIHHIVRFDEGGYFNAKHPLRERIDGELLDCKIFGVVMDWLGVPALSRKREVAGTIWRVKAASEHNLDANWVWEEL